MIARSLNLSVDDIIPLVEAVALLGFADTSEGFVALTPKGVEFAGVNQSHNSVVVFGKGKTVTDVLSARVRVSDKAIARSELANRVAAVILEQYPASAQQDRITISMDYGFDIGIASSWHSEHVSLPPGEWRQRLTAAAEAKAVMPATQE